MARTDKLQQSQIMLQAGQSGESARQRSHETRTQSRHTRVDQGQRQQQIDNTKDSQDQALWQRQWEQTRQDRAQRDEQRAKNQAGKPRTTNFGTEGTQSGGADPKLAESQRQFDLSHEEKQRQFDESQKLDAAKAGVQPGGGAQQPDDQPLGQRTADTSRAGMAPGDQGPPSPEAQLEEQEKQRRINQQMDRNIEQRGKSGYVPTPEAADIKEREVRAKEMTAQATYQRAVNSYNKSVADVAAASSAAGKKEALAQQKIHEANLIAPVKSDVKMLNRISLGKQTFEDQNAIRDLVNNRNTGVPNVGRGAEIHAAVNSGDFQNPVVQRWLSEKVAVGGIKYVMSTGKMPDPDEVPINMATAAWQEFQQNVMSAQGLLAPDTVAGKMFSAADNAAMRRIERGWGDHTLMVHKLGALLTMKGKGTGGMPHPATSGEQAPGFAQRGAASPARDAGQVTADEAGRRAEAAGGVAAPRTGKAPYKPDPFKTDRTAMGNW